MIRPWAAVSARIRVQARMAAVAALLSAGALFGLAATNTRTA